MTIYTHKGIEFEITPAMLRLKVNTYPLFISFELSRTLSTQDDLRAIITSPAYYALPIASVAPFDGAIKQFLRDRDLERALQEYEFTKQPTDEELLKELEA